jgi:acyl-CoA thioester hydrolase
VSRLHIPIPLRWGDLDAYGHINNVETLRLIEEARVRAFWHATGEDRADALPTAVMELDAASDVWSLVARTEIEYLSPMPYTSAPIDVEIWLGKVAGASIEVYFELYSPIGVMPRALYARAMTKIVTVDAASGRPTRIPADLREVWAPYQDEPLQFTRR